MGRGPWERKTFRNDIGMNLKDLSDNLTGKKEGKDGTAYANRRDLHGSSLPHSLLPEKKDVRMEEAFLSLSFFLIANSVNSFCA